MENKLKSSRYNFVFDLDDGTHVAFNALTGAFARIRPSDYDKLTSLLDNPSTFVSQVPEDARFLEDAKRARFIIDAETDELDLLRLHMNAAKFTSEHFHLTILPTLECNFQCPYCYEISGKGKMSSEGQERLCKWVDHKVKAARVMTVGWFGGEPLLANKVMNDLSLRFIASCEEREVTFRASITTNGYYLVPKIIEKLPSWGVDSIQVTLDGPPALHDQRRKLKNGKGTFTILMRNLSNLCDAHGKMRLTIRVNVDVLSYKNILDVLPLIPENVKNQCEIYFRQVFPPPKWWDENMPTKESSVSRQHEPLDLLPLHRAAQRAGFKLLLTNYFPSGGYCEADYANHFVVDEKCDLHKCTVAFDSGHRIGYLKDDGKAEFDIPLYAKWLSRDVLDLPKCHDCKVLPLCVGGCAFNMLCSKGRANCATFNTEESIVQNLKLLYENLNLQALRSQSRLAEELASKAIES